MSTEPYIPEPRYICSYCLGAGKVLGPPPAHYQTIQGKVDCPACVEQGNLPTFAARGKVLDAIRAEKP